MTKAEIRAALRARRREFAAELACGGNLLVATLAAAEQVTKRFGEARTIAAYVSLIDEIDPFPILLQAIADGRATALPRVTTMEAPLTFHQWLPGDPLEPGPFGLQQPRADATEVAPDLIVTPLVGFDRALNRLGQGAGFYDRAFRAHPQARRIGVGWSAQEVPMIPVDPWDVPLAGVATERAWIGA